MHFLRTLGQKEHFGTKKCLTLLNFFCFTHLGYLWDFHLQRERRTICWYVRKRTDHWCSESTGKSQSSGPQLGKPCFPLERWESGSNLGLGFSCHHWTPMMDSVCLAWHCRLSRGWKTACFCFHMWHLTENWFYHNVPKFSDRYAWANSADPDQTAPRAVWSGSTLFAILSAWFGLITLW